MAYDPRSAAVIGLCIGAVLLAAVLFPVAGIDGAPASSGETDGDASGVPEGEGSTTDGSSDGSAGDGTGEGSETGGDDGSSDDGTRDADAGSDAPWTGDDGSGTGESTEPEEPAADGTTWIDRLFEVMAIGLMMAVALLITAYASVTGKLAGWVEDSHGETDPLPDGPLPRLRFRLARISQVTMLATIGFARRAIAAWTAFAVLGRTVVRSILLVGAGVGTVFRSLRALSIGFPSIPRPRLPAIGWPGRSAGGTDGSRPRPESTTTGEATSVQEDEVYTEPETVEEAWRRLVASLPVRRPSVRTPRECAAIALDAGLPRDAVERLTATFEAVRYGGASRTPTRLERAREAYARIREARRGDGR